MQPINRIRISAWILLLICFSAGQASAATRVLDRIEISSEGDENIISVHFNVPVRYVSHLMNDAGSEVGVQLQIIQTQDVDLADLVARDQLTWSPSAEIPLNKVVFQGVPLGTSNLLVSFATPIKQFRIRQSRDFYVMDFLLKKPAALETVKIAPISMIDVDVPETKSPFNFKALSLTIYVINLSSQTDPIDLAKVAPVTVEDTQALYTTVAQIDGREWNRLRLGYFRTRQEAEVKLKAVKNFYPDAWIDQANLEERRQAMFKMGLLPPSEMAAESLDGAAVGADQMTAAQQAEVPEVTLPVDERLTNMMEQIRRTMTAGEYGKAVRMLEAMLEEPENYYTKEAMELLGLAHERNGQKAHAKAEYEAFLEKYPEGEDADRVKQRLLGLVTAPLPLREPLTGEKEKPVEWETYGSVSQNYRRDEINSPFVEDEDSVTRSEIETFVDLNSRRRGKEIDMRMKLTGSYTVDLLGDQGPGNDKTLSEAYVDVEHRDSRANMRLGRQRLRSSGILNRFDGLVLGYEVAPDIRLRAAAGLPVESSRDVFLHEHKQFAGISGDISNIIDNWDLSLFLVEQRVDSLIDRRAVGGELRYFDAEKSLFSLLDYDIQYGALNIFTLQGNWTLQDKTRLYMNFDFRKSPLLQTSTALNSYNDPLLYDLNPSQIVRVESIDDLLNYETEDAIYQRAEELTSDTTTLALGATRSLTDTLQISGDITITSTSSTTEQGVAEEPDPNNPGGTRPSNDYIAAMEDTGAQYFYSVQLIQNDLLKQGDIGILSLRYYDTSTSNTLRLGVSSRYPVTNAFRVNPRFDIAYRQTTETNDTRLTLSPYLRMDYRLRKDFTLEFEGGINWYKEETDLESTDYTDYYFQAGYRWDF